MSNPYKDIGPKANYLNQAVLNKARIDKFLLVLTMPEALRNIDVPYTEETPSRIVSEKLQMSVWGAIVPTTTIPSVLVPFGAQVPKISSMARASYDPVKVNFNIDNEFYNWYVIWKWLSLINEPETASFDAFNNSGIVSLQNSPNFLQKYSSNISIQALNEYNQIVCEFVYTQCFPISLDGINYNYQDAGEIVSGFTFEFSQLLFNINT